MSDPHYYQYAFARIDCSTAAIGAGVDPRFPVELVRDGPIAAVISRVGLDQFDPARLQGGNAEDLAWLASVAARHDEIIRQAARSSPVAPLRMGTVFCSLDSLRAAMGRLQESVVEFFDQLGDRQEWGVKLYRTAARAKRRNAPVLAGEEKGTGPICATTMQAWCPPLGRSGKLDLPPSSPRPGAEYLARKKAALEAHREVQADLQQAVEYVEQRLGGQAGPYCRVRTLACNLTGRKEEMVFNAALLLPPSALGRWLETAAEVRGELRSKGLLLEWSGPWPPYHFCPSLDLQ